jgi:ABC-type transporter Mla maintaining outer membrane lipid asymmetry ATPase subunit MlaF
MFRIADKIAMLYDGEIVAFGAPDEVRRSNLPAVKEFLEATRIPGFALGGGAEPR